MSEIEMALLGSMQVRVADNSVTRFGAIKVPALLAYLAVEAKSAHGRDTLMGLFWPDFTTDSARQNLRQTLFRLRQIMPGDHLRITS